MDITVGDLIQRLSAFSPGARVVFGGGPQGLDFYRVKHRGRDLQTGDEIVQIEFNQVVFRDSRGALVVEEP